MKPILNAEPIFKIFGRPVSWMEDGVVFNDDGCPVTFIDNESAFDAQTCHYLGHFNGGVFRDRLGCIVAFLPGAKGCDLLPLPPGAPAPPAMQSRTVPGRALLPAAPPHRVKPLASHSSLNWENF
jgi:hypothetical protein